MRKLLLVGICALMLAGLTACGGNSAKTGAEKTTTEAAVGTEFKESDTGEISIKEVPSEIYSQEDIDSAIDVIITEFTENWAGCRLKEIYYGGDELVKENESKAADYDADQVIVLLSTFDVDESGGANGSLEPGSTYKDWNWILVRKSGGQWQHVDHGY